MKCVISGGVRCVYEYDEMARCCTWRGIESNVRRAMEQAMNLFVQLVK